MAIKETDRRKVWVRCGGRCVICNRYLLDDGLVGKEVSLGELAHIVGQGEGPKTPRGGLLDDDVIDDPDNLVLVCPSEHDAIDHKQLVNLASVDVLRELKRHHEQRILHVTSLGHSNRTAVIRMVANLRGSAVEVSRDQVAIATLREGRFPDYPLAPDRQGLEIDLRQIAAEVTAGPAYYASAVARIDEVLDLYFTPAVEKGKIGAHVSVFAFARVPLLVHLGARLDDIIDAEIYDKQRDDGWAWPANDQTVDFAVKHVRRGERTDRVVLKLDISGTIAETDLPEWTAHCNVYRVAPVDRNGERNIIRSRADLAAFGRAINSFVATTEAEHKSATNIAVFPALPISAAVALGRAFARGIHPPLTVFDRPEHGLGFVEALTINPRTPTEAIE